MGKLKISCKASFNTVALPDYFSVTLSLLNLLEKSMGRSKPATRLIQAQ